VACTVPVVVSVHDVSFLEHPSISPEGGRAVALDGAADGGPRGAVLT